MKIIGLSISLLKKNMSGFYKKYWGGWKPKVFRKNFNKNNIKIVEYKNRRIAYYTLKFRDNHTYIDDIQISRFMRGKGLGTHIVGLMERETRKKFRKIRLKVFKDNKARNLYLKLGYKQIKDEGSTVILEKEV